jgi:hypothetical protein
LDVDRDLRAGLTVELDFVRVQYETATELNPLTVAILVPEAQILFNTIQSKPAVALLNNNTQDPKEKTTFIVTLVGNNWAVITVFFYLFMFLPTISLRNAHPSWIFNIVFV